MNTHQLNLARKWRSKTFDQIVGQELSIRMLKNSLYQDLFFPVYLFAGQRGCGKTSTARVFASAINCEKLVDFQKNPRTNVLPCLECSSCIAMQKGNHPDFIEMDAASHTGVDNVRQLIDAASFLPLLGKKKIYLIDEAHMLSKAAFNAFLKILEEPPNTVVFMLATTDPQKIISTVRSRCFQLFIKPIAMPTLMKHLQSICKQEKLKYTDDGLQLIARESDGSVRDALNILEQVRFGCRVADKQSVLSVLGHLDDDTVYALLETLLARDDSALLSFLHKSKIETFSPQAVWDALVDMLHSTLRSMYDIDTLYNQYDVERLQSIASKQNAKKLCSMLQILYDHELLFLKTTAQYQLLEVLLLQLCQIDQNAKKNSIEQNESKKKNSIVPHEPSTISKPQPQSSHPNIEWDTFLQKVVSNIEDPFLISIIKQGNMIAVTNETIKVSFPKNFSMFEDTLIQTQGLWQPILNEAFEGVMTLIPVFENAELAIQKKERVFSKKRPSQNTQSFQKKGYRQAPKRFTKNNVNKNEKVIDVSDKQAWEKTNALLQTFPGTVVEIAGDKNL